MTNIAIVTARRDDDLQPIREMLAEMENDMEPASKRQQTQFMAQLMAVMPAQNKSDSAWGLALPQYLEDISGYPLFALEAALRELRRTKTFMPSIAEIISAANPAVLEMTRQIERLRNELKPKALPAPPPEPPTDDEIEEYLKRQQKRLELADWARRAIRGDIGEPLA